MAFIKTLYERGVTMQKYRDEIQDNAIVGYMRNKNVVQTVLVSPYQIEQYYQQNLRLFQQDEQIKVSTIVLRKSLFPSQKTDADGKQVTYDPQEEIAKEILYKLDTGADFADLAKSYSEGQQQGRRRRTRLGDAERQDRHPLRSVGPTSPSCSPASTPTSSRPPTATITSSRSKTAKKRRSRRWKTCAPRSSRP